VHGAGGRKIGKTAARTVLAGAVFSTGPRTRLVDPETGEGLREYRIHRSRVVVQRASIIRARPEIERWGCVLDLEVDLDFTNPWQIEELLNISGRISGVGDYRPERRGPHGRYGAKLMEDVVSETPAPGRPGLMRPDGPAGDGPVGSGGEPSVRRFISGLVLDPPGSRCKPTTSSGARTRPSTSSS